MKDNRIQYIDIAKGMVLILVVWHHAHGPFTECIRAFHMPFFFLVSGLLYSSKASFFTFTRKRFVTLYVPFVFWNVLFYLGTNFDKLHSKYTWKFVRRIVLTLDKESQYLGATWFLGALFTECVIYKLLDVSMTKVKRKRLWITLIFVARGVFAFYHTLPYKLSRTLILGMFFAIGVLLKERIEMLKKYHSKWFVPVAVIPFVWIGLFTKHDMGDNQYTSLLVFVIGALLGCYIILCIAKWIERSKNKGVILINKCLSYISRNSMDVLIWHFVFFRIVIAFQLLLDGKSVWNVLKYGKRYDTSGLWWIAYILVGVTLSLCWGRLLRLGVWGKLFKKMHIIN